MSAELSALNDDLKRQVCRLVAGLVASDEEFDEVERTFIEKMLAGFGIPEAEWDAIFPLVDPGEAALAMRGLPGSAQKVAFELLLGAAVADGKVVEEERAFLVAVGVELGVLEADVDARLKEAQARWS